jgi:hypothetical protein
VLGKKTRGRGRKESSLPIVHTGRPFHSAAAASDSGKLHFENSKQKCILGRIRDGSKGKFRHSTYVRSVCPKTEMIRVGHIDISVVGRDKCATCRDPILQLAIFGRNIPTSIARPSQK